MSTALEVWLDCGLPGGKFHVGHLQHDRTTLRFTYTGEWLRHPQRFAIDPELSLDKGDFFAPAGAPGSFGVFDDASPDRWGQTLMKRREALEAKDQGRPPQVLRVWDYLCGVQDATRLGAVRLRSAGTGAETGVSRGTVRGTDGFDTFGTDGYIANDPLPAPPVASLRELEAVARALTDKRIDDLDALRRWLAVLVAPGASLGGARPKANFTDVDRSLWIAKFPSREDDRNIGAWEYLLHTLAKKAQIDVPPARCLKFGKDFHTFCTRRFDRAAAHRRFYASAMTLLRKRESEGSSYIEIAEFIQRNGAAGFIAQDLAQLYRRVAFNVATGNRDDHLRNHGFLLTAAGWRLAPAFDVNPNIDKAGHVLNLDADDNTPSLATVIKTAPWYGLSIDQGRGIVAQVLKVAQGWRRAAAKAGLSRADIELSAIAFEHAGHII